MDCNCSSAVLFVLSSDCLSYVLALAHLLYQQQILSIFLVMSNRLTPRLIKTIKYVTIALCALDVLFAVVSAATNSPDVKVGSLTYFSFYGWMLGYEITHYTLIVHYLGKRVKKTNQNVLLFSLKKYTFAMMTCAFFFFMLYAVAIALDNVSGVILSVLALNGTNVHLLLSILFNIKMKNVQFPPKKKKPEPVNMPEVLDTALFSEPTIILDTVRQT